MAYDGTDVSASRSQEQIRSMVYAHRGTGVMFMSHPPQEGFEAMVTMQQKPYHIRVMAKCKDVSRDKHGLRKTDIQAGKAREAEVRRVWRVLFHHLKAMFEAADSGVICIEQIFIPFVVTPDGRTLADHIIPRLAELQAEPSRLLPAPPAPRSR